MKRILEFEDYQKKLANQEKNLQLLLWSKKENKFFLYKPKTASIYGTTTQKTNYYKKLRQKLRIEDSSVGEKISFITLTYSTSLYSPEAVILRCKRDIQLWLKLIRNRIGVLKYFWICELTKQNYIHFHIITKQFIPHKIIKACWQKTTGSFITNVKGVSAATAGKYVTKYISDASKLSEDQAKFLYDNGFTRLYASSKNFFASKLKSKGLFYLIGIVTSPYCVASAEPGQFLEIEQIALNHIISLMEQGDWGYIKRY